VRTILDKPTRDGKRRRVVVELDEGEKLIAIQPDSYYQLGYPMNEDVIASHILTDAEEVSWCSLEQKWISP